MKAQKRPVAVIGGGFSGTMAAISAARAGIGFATARRGRTIVCGTDSMLGTPMGHGVTPKAM